MGLRRMKTMWGSSAKQAGGSGSTTEFAKKPPRALEYVVVHELAHVAIRRHGGEFFALLDRVLPHWRPIRAALGHEVWRKVGEPPGPER